MIKEANRWFLSENKFTIVPSTTPDLYGDMGLRSAISIDADILNETLNKLSYSDDNYYIYRRELLPKYLVYLLNGSMANPAYTNINSGYNFIYFYEFNSIINQYSDGDSIALINTRTGEVILETSINTVLILDNRVSAVSLDTMPVVSHLDRIKMVNTNGGIYGLTEIIRYNDIINHKLKFSNKLYANT